MKKFIKILFTIVIFFVLVMSFIFFSQLYLERKLEAKYDKQVEKSVSKDLSTNKFQGVYIQDKTIKKNDLILYGSSELSTTFIPEHPNNFYVDKNSNYNINVIGRGHSQSIVHAVNIGSLKSNGGNKKLAIMLSPQWFTPTGLSNEGFEANFSELQFYFFMINKKISKKVKIEACNRIKTLLKDTSNLKNIQIYTRLYSEDNILSKIALKILKPYYYIKRQVLYTLDLKQSLDIVNKLKNNKQSDKTKHINWKDEMGKAELYGEEACNNNNLGIYNEYYNKYVKKDYKRLKDANKDSKYTESPEFEDLKLLIKICKETGIDPLLISVPVQGKWYDHIGFSKSSREEYYKKIRNIASNNNVKLLDLSKYEYEKYFLCDVMHLGWKGWVHVNEGINKYYNEN